MTVPLFDEGPLIYSPLDVPSVYVTVSERVSM